MSQNVKIESDISGWVKGTFHVHFPNRRKEIWTEQVSLGKAIYAFNQFYWPDYPKQFTVNSDGNTIQFTGETECWDAGAGSSFTVEVQ